MSTRIKPEDIFQEFIKSFKTRGFLEKRTIPSMTKLLKEYFYDLGKRKGFQPWTTMRGKKKSYEYLTDVCWNVIGQKKIWLEMAMESELSGRQMDDILYDFEKLTDVKAFLKIGIFHPPNRRIDDIASECVEKIKRHKMKIDGEQYLVIFLTERHQKRKSYLKVSGRIFDNAGRLKRKMPESEFSW
jgi:hypothetical protein